MNQYILVQSTGSDRDAAVFDLALQVARRGRAHLEMLHVSPDVRDVLAAMTPGLMGDGAGLQKVVDEFDQAAQERAQRAEQDFRIFCERERIAISGDTGASGITAVFRREIGIEASILPRHGLVADLIVAGRKPGENNEQDALLATLLLETGRPLLLAPAVAAPLAPDATVAIAWKDAPQAAHAVAAATPFIESARRVVILTVDEGDSVADDSSGRLAQALAWRTKKVSALQVPLGGRLPGDALLAATAQAGAGLLVMGGYGHARLREAVFGGVTRRVLTQADIPVLMMH